MYHNKLSKQLVLVTTFQDMYVTVPYLSGAPVKASVHPLNPGITPSHQTQGDAERTSLCEGKDENTSKAINAQSYAFGFVVLD